jgi:toxin ParE1/3/4
VKKKKYKINFLPESVDDIEQAKTWYNQQKLSLGEEFVDEVEKIVDIIQYNPYQFSEKYKKMRQVKTARFPYLISYIIENMEIIILSVLHGKRNPKEFKRRYK